MTLLYSYCMSFVDEQDVLPDALDSLARVSDSIFLVDGGMGTLVHKHRYTQPLSEWIQAQAPFKGWYGSSADRRAGSWNDVPLVLYDREFKDPGDQRNWITPIVDEHNPDWVLWIDSDEVLSDQLVDDIKRSLSSIPDSITNICPKWLTLVQDEQHCVPHMSGVLAHGRLYRPHTVYYNNGWHEHQYYKGARELWDSRVIHTRALYRNRLYVQRGHPKVSGNINPLWGDAQIMTIPVGVTWPSLHWPANERIVPFDVDVREFYKE